MEQTEGWEPVEMSEGDVCDQGPVWKPDQADLAGAVSYTTYQLTKIVAQHSQQLDRIANHATGLPTREDYDALVADAQGVQRQITAIMHLLEMVMTALQSLERIAHVLHDAKAA